MKTRKFKFFVPLSVLLFAIGAAFAFNTPQIGNLQLVEDGYIFKDNICQREGSCTNTASTVCTHNGNQVFGIEGNNCVKILYNNWQSE